MFMFIVLLSPAHDPLGGSALNCILDVCSAVGRSRIMRSSSGDLRDQVPTHDKYS